MRRYMIQKNKSVPIQVVKFVHMSFVILITFSSH